MLITKIVPKFNNFMSDNFMVDKYFNEISNYMLKYNIISIGIDDIIKKRKNNKKWILSAINCVLLWLMFIIFISFLLSNQLMNLIKNSLIPIDQLKQSIGAVATLLFIIINLKTDLLREEKRNNLIWLKFIYYLMINDQLKHKLNNHNYKLLKLIVKIINILSIKIAHWIIVLIILPFSFLFLLFTKLLVLIVFSPVIVYTVFVYFTSAAALIQLVYFILIYYIMRFTQINTQLRLFYRIKRISPRMFIQTINEHNQLSLEIYQLNQIMNKSVACLFIITAFSIDIIIYLLTYTKLIYFKLFLVLSLSFLFAVIFTVDILLIKLSNSAHRSYNLMYLILKRPNLPYRIKFKVII